MHKIIASFCVVLGFIAMTPVSARAGAGDDIELYRYRDVLDPNQLACPAGTRLVIEDSEDGTQEVCLSKSGVRHGYFLRWHKDGRTWAEVGAFKEGQKHGRWMTFDAQGRTRLVRFYSHGDLRSESAQ